MSENRRLELCLRQHNVIYLAASHSGRGHPDVCPASAPERAVVEPVADFHLWIAATRWQDGLLMVGG
jgi:hypothetical protein